MGTLYTKPQPMEQLCAVHCVLRTAVFFAGGTGDFATVKIN